MNLFDVELQRDDDDPPGYGTSYAKLREPLGGKQIGVSVYEMEPGQSICPYHYETGEEEWLLVLSGTVTLRTPAGERELGPWDVAFFPAGEEGAHKVTGAGDGPARVCMWSNVLPVATSVYPDSGKVGAWPPGKLFRLGDAVDYWDGESEGR